MKNSFFAILATTIIASSIPLQFSYATESIPATNSSTSTPTTTSPATSIQTQEQAIQWKVEQLEVEKLTPMNIEHYKKFIATPGNHLVIYGLTLKEQLPLLQQLYTPSNGKFRLDYELMTSKDQGGNINKDKVLLPMFLSLANVNDEVQVTYGTTNITAKTMPRDTLIRDLRKESSSLHKELKKLIEKDVKWFLFDYEQKRQTVYAKPAFDRIGVVNTYLLEYGSMLPVIGKVEGYWVINKESSPIPAANKTTFTVQSDFTYKAQPNSVVSYFQIDSFKTGIQVKNETAEMVSGSPVATGFFLDGDKGVTTPKWPGTGFSAVLDASVTNGKQGSYLMTVKQKNSQHSLPETFPLLFSTTFTSTTPTASIETQQWFRTAYKDNEVYYVSSNDVLRND